MTLAHDQQLTYKTAYKCNINPTSLHWKNTAYKLTSRLLIIKEEPFRMKIRKFMYWEVKAFKDRRKQKELSINVSERTSTTNLQAKYTMDEWDVHTWHYPTRTNKREIEGTVMKSVAIKDWRPMRARGKSEISETQHKSNEDDTTDWIKPTLIQLLVEDIEPMKIKGVKHRSTRNTTWLTTVTLSRHEGAPDPQAHQKEKCHLMKSTRSGRAHAIHAMHLCAWSIPVQRQNLK